MDKRTNQSLINRYKILSGAKCFYSGILQNDLLFIPAKK